jgi:hypothetical protein
VWIAAAVLIAVLAIVVSIVISQPDGEPEIETAVPKEFAGDWTGTYKTGDGSQEMKVSFTLRPGKARGAIAYQTGDCNASLTPVGVDDDGALVVREYTGDSNSDSNCQDADLHIAREDGRVRVAYTEPGATTPRAFIEDVKRKRTA